MFRTRANIHQKACQHKTIKAVERMYIIIIIMSLTNNKYMQDIQPVHLLQYYRYIEAVGLVKDLQIIWVPRYMHNISCIIM